MTPTGTDPDAPLGEQILAVVLRWLARRLEPYRPLAAPAAFHIDLTPEADPMLGFKITAQLPDVSSTAHVAKQQLAVSINGSPQGVQEPATDVTSVDLGTVKDGDRIMASLVYLDDQGNHGLKKTVELTVDSAKLPPQPEGFGLAFEEVEVPDGPTP